MMNDYLQLFLAILFVWSLVGVFYYHEWIAFNGSNYSEKQFWIATVKGGPAVWVILLIGVCCIKVADWRNRE